MQESEQVNKGPVIDALKGGVVNILNELKKDPIAYIKMLIALFAKQSGGEGVFGSASCDKSQQIKKLVDDAVAAGLTEEEVNKAVEEAAASANG